MIFSFCKETNFSVCNEVEEIWTRVFYPETVTLILSQTFCRTREILTSCQTETWTILDPNQTLEEVGLGQSMVLRLVVVMMTCLVPLVLVPHM